MCSSKSKILNLAPGVGDTDNSTPGLLPLITVLEPFGLCQMALTFLLSRKVLL